MSHGLTQKQQALLRFLVEKVNEGVFEEDEIPIFMMLQGPMIEGMGENAQPLGLSENNLAALERAGMLIISRGNMIWNCGLTALAFDAAKKDYSVQNWVINESRLLSFLDKCFQPEEIELLCFKLNVDYGNISGTRKDIKIKNLIEHMRHLSRQEELVREALSL